MIITRQETSDNIRNEIDEESSNLHFFFSFISQDTKQLQEMQQDNQSSREKLDRQKIDDDAIMNDVDADKIEMKRELAVLREKRRLAHLRQKFEQIKIDKTLRFLVVTLSIRSRQEDEL
jgi:cell shape-determining protein MreC